MFSSSIDSTAASRAPGRRDSVALRLENDSGSETLREQERVARLRAGLRPDVIGMDDSDDCKPVLRLRVANRVTSREDRSRRAHALFRSREDLAEHLDRQLLGERGNRQCEKRPAAHREDVVQRVRRGDRPERSRIVDERREEVDGEDDRPLVIEPIVAASSAGSRPTSRSSASAGTSPARSVSSRAAEYFAAHPPPAQGREGDGLHDGNCTRKEFPRVARTIGPERSTPFPSPPDVAAAAPSAAAFYGGGKRCFPARTFHFAVR